MGNHDLAEMLAIIEMPPGFLCIHERKYAVDNWPQLVLRDGAIHVIEIIPAAYPYSSQCDATHEQAHEIDCFAGASEKADQRHFPADGAKQTMRRFDESCLTPVRVFTAEEIRTLREREEVSQMVFAQYLNVKKDSVSQWERGEKHPSGPSLKLLSLVEKNGLEAIA